MTTSEWEDYHRKKHEAKIEREKTAKMMDLQYFLESKNLCECLGLMKGEG